MTIRALVVGLGQIGMGYDLDQGSNVYALTHARAAYIHPDFQLVGGVDSEEHRCRLFEKKYLAPSFLDITSAMHALKPDLVVIATPTEEHYRSVSEVLSCERPTAILCEKPLSYSLSDAKRIVAEAERLNCSLYVNHMRISDRAVANIKDRIINRDIIAPVKCVAWYTKGLFNNGSHLLNLLQYWLGEVEDVNIINPGRLWAGTDPEPDVCLQFASGSVFLLSAREENFSHYTIEMIAGNGRLSYEDGGKAITWKSVIDDSICQGYRVLSQVNESLASDLDCIQWHVMDQLAKSLRGESAQICTGKDALRTLELLTRIKAKL